MFQNSKDNKIFNYFILKENVNNNKITKKSQLKNFKCNKSNKAFLKNKKLKINTILIKLYKMNQIFFYNQNKFNNKNYLNKMNLN